MEVGVKLVSKYTTQLRFICEYESGYLESHGLSDLNEILILATPKIFDFEYPIFVGQWPFVLILCLGFQTRPALTGERELTAGDCTANGTFCFRAEGLGGA